MDYLTTAEAAKLLMVSPGSIRLWIDKGWLNAQVTPGGHRRILRRDIDQFARKRGLALANEAGTFRILIVDDDKQITELLRELFSRLDASIEVAIAQSGFEAGYYAHEFSPNIILLDLMMPSLDGFEVCKLLKSDPETSHIKIVVMTGYYSEENVAKVISLGADYCLAKPFEAEELLEAIGLSGALQPQQDVQSRSQGR